MFKNLAICNNIDDLEGIMLSERSRRKAIIKGPHLQMEFGGKKQQNQPSSQVERTDRWLPEAADMSETGEEVKR